jgi:hypothetical protein
MRAVLLPPLALLLTGCPNHNNVSTVSGFGTEVGKAYCQVANRCGTLPDCDSTWAVFIGLFYQLDYAPLVASGSLKYDPNAAQACLNDLNGTSCNDLFGGRRSSGTNLGAGQSCRTAIMGTVIVGGACHTDIECKDGGACLKTAGQCTGTCGAPTAGGADCNTLGCPAGQYCAGTSSSTGFTYSCKPLEQAGGTCDTSSQCVSTLDCVPSGGSTSFVGTCAQPPGNGSPCFDECATGLTCSIGTTFQGSCVQPPGKGQPCTTSCAQGYVCAGTPATCVSSPVGQPCKDDMSCSSSLLLFYYCKGASTGVTGVCEIAPAVGSACDPTADHCLIGFCDPASKVCKDPLPVGSACIPNATKPQCGGVFESETCDPTTMKCTASCM